MPYFRDDNGVYKLKSTETPEERLELAKWYHWCGWAADADAILREIAEAIPDEYEPPKHKVRLDHMTYEEARFEYEDERAAGN